METINHKTKKGLQMIANVVMRANLACVYDERGNSLSTNLLGSKDILMGFTGTSYSVGRGALGKKHYLVATYDERSNCIGSYSV